MRRTAYILAGAIAFDLGVMVVAGQAAGTWDLPTVKSDKVGSMSSSQGGTGKVSIQDLHFTKIDPSFTSQACLAHNGTVVRNSAGVQACQSKEAIPGAQTMGWPSKAGN